MAWNEERVVINSWSSHNLCHKERKYKVARKKCACDPVSIKKRANEKRCMSTISSFINSDNKSESYTPTMGSHECYTAPAPTSCVENVNTLSVERKNIASCRCQDGWLQLKHPNHHLGVIPSVICHGTVVVTGHIHVSALPHWVSFARENEKFRLVLFRFHFEVHLFIQQIFISRHGVQGISKKNLMDFHFARDSVFGWKTHIRRVNAFNLPVYRFYRRPLHIVKLTWTLRSIRIMSSENVGKVNREAKPAPVR